MVWSDQQLRTHKKVQAGISVAGSALGLSALSAKGAGALIPKVARAGRLAPLAPKLDRAATNLTIGGAGLGGVGGLNFAGIQSAEAKKKVSKVMTVSAWGVDHGSEVSKRASFDPSKPYGLDDRRHESNTAALKGAAVGAPLFSAAVRGSSAANAASGGASVMRSVGAGRMSALKTGAKLGGTALTHTKGPGLFGALVTGSLGASVAAQHADRRGMERIAERKSYLRQQKQVFKAFDPERGRAQRLNAYQTGAGAAAGALGVGAGFQGAQAARKLKPLAGRTLVPTATLKGAAKHGGIGVGLGLGAVGAGIAAQKIGDYRRGSGRPYRAFN